MLFLIMAGLANGQTTGPTTSRAPLLPVNSPEIHGDGRVTFRLRAAGATAVSVSVDPGGGMTPMVKDSQGVWSATVGPLGADIYEYGFRVDGVRMLDPANPVVQPGRAPTTSLLEIPAEEPRYYDFQDVPHGVVRLEMYRSKSLGRLRAMRVYTPAGYDQNSQARYPVLFLLHGYGDTEATWSSGAGRAPWIADDLIAEGKATPMIIVMPDGHAVVPPGSGRDAKATLGNLLAFESDLIGDVILNVEANYRVEPGRENRAIIGLSMGGRQSLTIGLQRLDLFAWVGGMSAVAPTPETTFAGILKDPQGANERLKLLWFCCGKGDPLMVGAREFDGLLSQHGIHHQFVEFPGEHEWGVWRPALREFLGLIFK
jgi:enterochelin esterase-like enzyme